VLVPHADGAGNDLLVGKYLQLAFVFYAAMTIPGVIIWVTRTEDALRWFGFDDETAFIGQEYAYTYLFYLFVDGILRGFAEFLNTLDHELFATVFTIVAKAAESLALLALGMVGVKDLVVVGLVQITVGCVGVVLSFAIALRKGWMEPYLEGVVRTNGLKDRRAMHTVFITAVPLGLSWLLTFGEVRLCDEICRLR
jgi:Na+-driven multidrug efflux pump